MSSNRETAHDTLELTHIPSQETPDEEPECSLFSTCSAYLNLTLAYEKCKVLPTLREVATNFVGHKFDVAFAMVIAISNESDVMFNKGIGITLSEEKPEKEEGRLRLPLLLLLLNS